MEIENGSVNLNVGLSLKEARIMEYALRKSKDISGIDILLSDIDGMLDGFRRLLSENWVAPIQEELQEPIVIPFKKEQIDII